MTTSLAARPVGRVASITARPSARATFSAVRAMPIVLALLAACASPPPATPPRAHPVPYESAVYPGLDAIREEDLRRDLGVLAGDAMRGREAGTADELRASAWLAEQARAAGLEPAGDDGTYFQVFRVRRTRQREESRAALGGQPLALGREAVLLAPAEARLDVAVVWVGRASEAELARADVRGKAAAALLVPPEGAPPVGPDLMPRRYAMLAVRQQAARLIERGAAAVILVSDEIADAEHRNIGFGWMRGSYENDSGGADTRALARPPVLWLRRDALERVRAPRQRLTAMLATETFVVPSVNVVARAPGRDSALRAEHVLFSAHQDGLGTRFAWEGDSIWNGADDNATTSVALLAIGRAFTRAPARRSALFVWHGSEEAGLLGSRWHVAHPTVPLDRIVAVLNGDMTGHNHPDTAALLGSTAPNRNSAALVALALRANAATARFAVDSSWDRPGHPEGFFRRSDHWPYVQRGIPAVYFTTMLHPDYHTPRDETARVDVTKLTRVARWMYGTGWLAAEGTDRPGLDEGVGR